MNKLIKIRKYMILTSLIGLFAMSCAPNPIDVMAVPAAQGIYMSDYYTCEILQLEFNDAETRAAAYTATLSKAHKSDKVLVGASAGVGFFFLFALLGLIGLSSVKGTDKSSELAVEKGKIETLNRVMAMKGCK